MVKEVQLASRYISHHLTSMNEHGAHSPFLYDLLTKCIYANQQHAGFAKIEALRNTLKSNYAEIKVTDLGAGSTYDGIPASRTIASITKNFSKPPRLCKLLFRLTQYFKPGLMLELGTSMGISAMYQALGNSEGKIYTVEGCPATFEQAQLNIKSSGISNISCINNSFDKALPEFIAQQGYPNWAYIDGNHTYESTVNYFHHFADSDNDNMILVFDDINWSEGMQKAWAEICKNDRVTMTINLFYIGLVFFNKKLSKQDFKIRFY
jgi:predicted O-methyltransferase YrrM